MTAQWQHIVRPSWAHWADTALADAWFRRARDLAGDGAVRALDGQPFDRQRAQVRAAWDALANGYRALDLRPTADPQYREVMRAWYGQCRAVARADAVEQRVRALIAGGHSGATGRAADMVRAQWARMGKPPLDGAHVLCDVIVRANLSELAEVVETCGAGRGGEDLCAFEGMYMGCAYVDAAREGCDPYDWRALAWHDPPAPLEFLSADSVHCRVAKALPPLLWSLLVARDLAAQCTGRGALRVLEQSRRIAMGRNLVTARDLGLLRTQDVGTERERAALEALARVALSTPARVEAEAFDNERMSEANAALGGAAAATAVVTAINPVIGLVFGVATAGVRVLLQAVGIAVGIDTDELGRARPVFERWHISGGPGPSNQPSHAVPAPPGWTRPAVQFDVMATVVNLRPAPDPTAPAAPGAPSPADVATLLAQIGTTCEATRAASAKEVEDLLSRVPAEKRAEFASAVETCLRDGAARTSSSPTGGGGGMGIVLGLALLALLARR